MAQLPEPTHGTRFCEGSKNRRMRGSFSPDVAKKRQRHENSWFLGLCSLATWPFCAFILKSA